MTEKMPAPVIADPEKETKRAAMPLPPINEDHEETHSTLYQSLTLL